jgi:hypothetical protein
MSADDEMADDEMARENRGYAAAEPRAPRSIHAPPRLSWQSQYAISRDIELQYAFTTRG